MVAAACFPGAGPSGGSGAPAGLDGTRWRLSTLDGKQPVSGGDATLEFSEAGRVAGSASCNRFTGGVTITGDTLAFTAFAVTRMLCAPPIMEQETAYLAALGTGGKFELKGDKLEFTNAGKTLVFTRM